MGYAILALAVNPWDGPWMNRQQLLSRLGREHDVLYSNGVLSVTDLKPSMLIQQGFLGDVRTQDNVRIDDPPKFLLRSARFSKLNRIVLKMAGNRWRKILLPAKDRPLISYIFHPQFYDYPNFVNPDYTVYHAYDLFHMRDYWSEQLDRAQVALLKDAHLVVASSDAIASSLRKKAKCDPVVIPNGVDFELFSSAVDKPGTEPPDIAKIPRPRISYVGNITSKVDFGLLADLAVRNPLWNFVLVGRKLKLDKIAQEGYQKCLGLQNVYFLGEKGHLDLPVYAVNMDVNIMIYRTSNRLWCYAGYPLKMHEYLAVGKPIVSSDIESVRPFKNVLRVARNLDDWECAIREGICGRGVGSWEERRAVASNNTWDHRVCQLDQELRDMVRRTRTANSGRSIARCSKPRGACKNSREKPVVLP